MRYVKSGCMTGRVKKWGLTGRRQGNVERQDEPVVGRGRAVVGRVAVVRVYGYMYAVRRPLDVRYAVQLPPAGRRR